MCIVVFDCEFDFLLDRVEDPQIAYFIVGIYEIWQEFNENLWFLILFVVERW